MKCPNDETTLTMSERGGIEIDYCPECRGVWLDRGELDKIIERSLTQAPPAPTQSTYERERDERAQRNAQRYAGGGQAAAYGGGYHEPHRKKRKESWLSELFD